MKKLLLDTQVLIWLAQEPQKISGKVKLQLSAINELLLSHVSVWEMAIKVKTGKLQLHLPLEQFIQEAVQKHTLDFLPVSLTHIYHTRQLPLHHHDPFDRLLIAQSITENIPVTSSDGLWDACDVNRIWN